VSSDPPKRGWVEGVARPQGLLAQELATDGLRRRSAGAEKVRRETGRPANRKVPRCKAGQAAGAIVRAAAAATAAAT